MTTRFTPFLDEIDAALRERQSLKDQNANLRDQLNILRDAAKEHCSIIRLRGEQIDNLRNEKAELTNTLAVTRAVLATKTVYISNLEATLQEKLGEIASLKDQVNDMEERMDDARHDASSLRMRLEDERAERQALTPLADFPVE